MEKSRLAKRFEKNAVKILHSLISVKSAICSCAQLKRLVYMKTCIKWRAIYAQSEQ